MASIAIWSALDEGRKLAAGLAVSHPGLRARTEVTAEAALARVAGPPPGVVVLFEADGPAPERCAELRALEGGPTVRVALVRTSAAEGPMDDAFRAAGGDEVFAALPAEALANALAELVGRGAAARSGAVSVQILARLETLDDAGVVTATAFSNVTEVMSDGACAVLNEPLEGEAVCRLCFVLPGTGVRAVVKVVPARVLDVDRLKYEFMFQDVAPAVQQALSHFLEARRAR